MNKITSFILGFVLIANANAALLGDWNFDSPSDQTFARDSSGYDNHGWPYAISWGAGLLNQGYSFNGFDSSVLVYNSPTLNFTDKMTVRAFVKPNIINNGAIIGRTAGAVPYDYSFALGMLGGQYTMAIENDAGIVTSGIGMPTIVYANGSTGIAFPHYERYLPKIGKWSCVYATFDNGIEKQYVDGKLVGSFDFKTYNLGTLRKSNPVPGVPLLNPIFMGRPITLNHEYFNGTIDEVRLWDEVLSDEEIMNDCTELAIDQAYVLVTNCTATFVIVSKNKGLVPVYDINWSIQTGKGTTLWNDYLFDLQPNQTADTYASFNYVKHGDYVANITMPGGASVIRNVSISEAQCPERYKDHQEDERLHSRQIETPHITRLSEETIVPRIGPTMTRIIMNPAIPVASVLTTFPKKVSARPPMTILKTPKTEFFNCKRQHVFDWSEVC